MTWVVDTCVILDILDGASEFARKSAQTLQSKLDDVLLIAPVSYIELAPAFNGDTNAQDEYLQKMWVQCDFGGDKAAVLAAHKAWNEHILRKRAGELKKRPIADVLIGAYALRKGGLITRNEADFRVLFPALPICNPVNFQL